MLERLEVSGIKSIGSRYPVGDSVERIVAALRSEGVTVFAVIDQSKEAGKVGLALRPTSLIIFGDPTAGTPLMENSPSLAIDLPLKALVWEGPGGRTLVSYNSPEYLQRRHALEHAPFGGVGALLARAVE
jgi:uncharacterized protein (DUF302 family)